MGPKELIVLTVCNTNLLHHLYRGFSVIFCSLCTPKVTQVKDDADLKMMFDDADMLGILVETGFRIPLHSIRIKNKCSIVSSLKDYHCIIKVSRRDCVSKWASPSLQIMGISPGANIS